MLLITSSALFRATKFKNIHIISSKRPKKNYQSLFVNFFSLFILFNSSILKVFLEIFGLWTTSVGLTVVAQL